MLRLSFSLGADGIFFRHEVLTEFFVARHGTVNRDFGVSYINLQFLSY